MKIKKNREIYVRFYQFLSLVNESLNNLKFNRY